MLPLGFRTGLRTPEWKVHPNTWDGKGWGLRLVSLGWDHPQAFEQTSPRQRTILLQDPFQVYGSIFLLGR